jgi:hypothetical protein
MNGATMFIRTFIAAATVAATLGANSASANPHLKRILNCSDSQGRRVMTLINTSIGPAAILIHTYRRVPVIVLNGKMLKRVGMPTLVFAFYRKCAHLKLRHPAKRNIRHEAQADCWAIQHMARRKLLNVATTNQIIKSVYRYTGNARGKYVLSCARRVARHIPRGGRS